MRISFDLDEVLFVDPRRYSIEPVPSRLHGMLLQGKTSQRDCKADP